MSRFHLVKWYLDCVDASGRAVIVYWARLEWRALATTWSSMLIDGIAREHLFSEDPPVSEDGTVTWSSRGLAACMTIEGRDAPYEATLHSSAAGSVEWRCEVPAGRATFSSGGGARLEGWGYAERLTMTIPPWQLPIDELRWGRFASRDSAIVWIDWKGEAGKTLVLDASSTVPAAQVVGNAVMLSGDSKLELTSQVTLRDAPLGGVLSNIPILSSMLPRRIAGAREQKWRSRARLHRAGANDEGWAIHELVRFA